MSVTIKWSLYLIMALMVVGMSNATNFTTGLNLYLNLSSTTADQSGHFADGTDYAGSYVSGYLDNGADFNPASNQRIEIPDPGPDYIDNINGITINLWAYPTARATSMRMVHLNGVFSNIIEYSEDEIRWRVYDTDGTTYECQANTVVSYDVWTMFTVTYDGTSGYMEIYHNGTSVRTCTGTGLSGALRDRALKTYIGIDEDENTAEYDGTLDEIGIWNYTMSDAEVTELFGNYSAGYSPFYVPPYTPPASTPSYNVSVPYSTDFEAGTNFTLWSRNSTVFINNCTGAVGAPTHYSDWHVNASLGATYYSSADTVLYTYDANAHATYWLQTPTFTLNGSASNASFWMVARAENNYDGLELLYQFNETGDWQWINDTSTVNFTELPSTNYYGYNGHGTSTTSCKKGLFNNNFGYMRINLTIPASTGNISFRFQGISDTSTDYTDPDGFFIDDFAISYTEEEAPPEDSCTCPGAGNNWAVNLADYCQIASSCSCAALSFYGDGNFTIGTGVTVDTNGLIYYQNLTAGDTIWLNGTAAIT